MGDNRLMQLVLLIEFAMPSAAVRRTLDETMVTSLSVCLFSAPWLNNNMSVLWDDADAPCSTYGGQYL